jgi:hypothetical protein
MLVTIYSQHPSRGKVQVLATYRAQSGVVSSTVTSVEGSDVAAPIVEALNRISACTTVPVSVWDRRDDRIERYPSEHLAALIDHRVRPDLLQSAHSLWYGYVKLLLHRALTDLDTALAAVPTPVRTAIAAELAAEERFLREALAEYSTGVEPPERPDRRRWDFEYPFVTFEGGSDLLADDDRDSMNRLEGGADSEQIEKSVSDMRLMLEVDRRSNNKNLMTLDMFTFSHDPVGGDRYYLNVEAPLPDGMDDRHEWNIEIGRWDVDLDDPENEGVTAKGESVLVCGRASAPSVGELVELLTGSGERPEQLAAWAMTPVGENLAGTVFSVTRRFDGPAAAASGDWSIDSSSDDSPNFVELFPVCRCGSDDCLECTGMQLTPRTADALYSAASLLADQAFDDVEEHGDRPVEKSGNWAVFDTFPRITWRQDAAWRRQAARAFDDLCGDLAAGEWPRPRCAAEEMAAHLTLRLAKDGVADEWLPISRESMEVPRHEDDLDWESLGDVLFQDIDILSLFDQELDGIEDPESDLNRYMAMGDYRPQSWFETFNNMEPRDTHRPFRR